jgi:hypothetical protein
MPVVISGTNGVSGVDGTASNPSYEGTDSNTGIFFPAADTVAIATGGTQRLTVNSSGNTQTVGTISVGNATPSTSGAGITFPATQSASSDANTLDDYEEGTWNITVSYSGSTSGVTYAARTGYYTKIGNVVTVQGAVSLSSKGTGSGTVRISLPFQTIGDRGGLAVGNTQQITVNNSPRELMVEGATSYFVIRYPNGTGNTTEILYGDISNSFYLAFGGTYLV